MKISEMETKKLFFKAKKIVRYKDWSLFKDIPNELNQRKMYPLLLQLVASCTSNIGTSMTTPF